MISPRERYILTDYPQIEVVQIQFNYVDYDDPAVQSRQMLRGLPQIRQARHRHGAGQGRQPRVTCRTTRRPCWTGSTAAAPRAMPSASPRAFPGMLMVLSGMSTPGADAGQHRLHAATSGRWMSGSSPPSSACRRSSTARTSSPAPSCRYCTDGCPQHIAIPDLFATDEHQADSTTTGTRTITITPSTPRPAAGRPDCVKCGQCETRLSPAPAHPPSSGGRCKKI